MVVHLVEETTCPDVIRNDDADIFGVLLVVGHEQGDKHTMVEKKGLVGQELFRKRGKWITAIPKSPVQRSPLRISSHILLVFLHS